VEADEHRERLAAFVVRARRVLASPLAQDDEQLARAAQIKLDVRDGSGFVLEWLPDESALESLAARLRPLLLQRDPVYYGKAFASLGYLVRQSAGAAAEVKAHRKRWDNVVEGPGTRFYVQQIAADSGRLRRSWRDRELADAWFYGDLIHADEGPAGAEAPSLESRFHAAFAFIADVVALLWRALGLVYMLRASLALPDWAWTTPVGVDGGQWRERPGQIFMAPEGTPLPDGELGDEWRQVGPEWPGFLLGPQPFAQPQASDSGAGSTES